MGDVSKVISNEDTATLRARGWLDDPLLLWIALHILFQVNDFVRQYVGLWDEAEVLGSVNLSQSRNLSIHEIFARYVERAREVVHFLVLMQ